MARKGQPNPNAGRKPGSPNKITATLKEMILGALDEAGGQAYLVKQANDNPVAFMTLVGKVLPMTITGDGKEPVTFKIIHFTGGQDG